MIHTVKTGMVAISSLIMRCLVVCGIVVEDSIYVENWRRPRHCDCRGCRNWKRGKPGTQQCRRRFLQWRDKVSVGTHWVPGMACLWIAVLCLCFFNIYASIGVVALVTTAGKNDLLTQYFKGSAYTAAWFIGLVDGGSTPTYAAGDTMASHAGWTENTSYSNSTRVAWTGGSASAGSIDNSGSPAAFNINATATIAGMFMVTNSTKSGATGTLYSEGNFTQGNRSVTSGDTLNCTATETAA